MLCTLALCPPGFSQSFSSSNLPIILINTGGQAIPDEPKITADMGIIYNGPGVRNNITDPPNDYNGKIGIEIRGSSSQMFPKKQYAIELRDALGEGIDASLLGLPKKDDWVLFAPYNDKSLMRDVLAYKLGRDLGRYASRWKYCEVVLNGQYAGIYVLLEKIKRDKNRVNIDKLEPTEISGENLTGGYIVKIDKPDGIPNEGWTSPFPPPGRSGSQTINILYEYPKPEDIVSEQRAYIQNFFRDFEYTLADVNFKDPAEGYRKYIDVESFIDYFIVNEISRNVDAYRISTYMHKKNASEGGKLFMGPVWDFNLGFGNVNYCTGAGTSGFAFDFNSFCPNDNWLIPFWWNRLMEDDAFKSQLMGRWKTLREGPYQTSRITGFIDSVAAVLNQESQQRNFQRWPVLGEYVWPNAFVGSTFQSEVDWLKSWIVERLVWLDANILDMVTAIEDKPVIKPSVVAAPNPFSEHLDLTYEVSYPGITSVDLRDAAGNLIQSFEYRHPEGGKQHVVLPVQGLRPGLYLLRVRTIDGIQFLKVVRK